MVNDIDNLENNFNIFVCLFYNFNKNKIQDNEKLFQNYYSGIFS